MSNKFTRDYFIAKFEAIPDAQWHVGHYRDPQNPARRCALGHCRNSKEGAAFSFEESTDEEMALHGLLAGSGPAVVNDGKVSRYQQPTPKARILAALRDLPATATAPLA